MGIRSLLRNAFGRSKATREETGAAPSGAAKPESATIPEAREESTPAPATPAPEAEVPAARTAPTESPATDPAPATPTLPAQGTRPDVAERAAETSAAREESAVRDAAEARDRAEVRDEPAAEPVATAEPAAAEPVEAADASSDSSSDTVSDLVSQAFDNPAPAAAAEPTADTADTDDTDDTAAPTAEAEAAEEEVEAEPEPVAAAAEPEPVAAAAEPEPTTAPETSATETEPEPAATAVAEPEPEPEATAETAPAPDPEAKPTPVAATATDPKAAGTTAPTTPPALDSLVKSAAAVLDKHGLATQRAVVYLVLDRSGSMRNYYKDGTVQNLAEQALGLSARLDDAATVPVIFFSTDIDGTADLDLTHYEGRIAELHAGLGHMGRTNYHWAINAVVEHYKKSGSTAPAFVIFQTDGAPTSKPAAEKALCEAAELPIFWQFLGFGDPDAKGFDFLRKLDDLTVPERRAVDNAGFFHAGRDPRSLSHDELYQQLMVEFPEWLAEARSAGILKDS
ncbi:VWA domain-containing protein [Streptomyces sioyaensis]|uniref:vWA domain-containing protein n=1 Tax=Streptomyces sioyaensis TaxID=67364 RepID=UPI0036E1EF18